MFSTLNVTAWFWIHLIGGVILVLAGFGILSGNVLARTVGAVAAGLCAIYNFAWRPHYPVWSMIVITRPDGMSILSGRSER